jgi:cell division protein FtsA
MVSMPLPPPVKIIPAGSSSFLPISLEVFPVGSTAITNDIALGLKIPLEEAELVKLGKGGQQFPKKRLNDIVESRLDDMFNLVSAHLKKIGKNELLPAGIILTGGGSGIETIEDFARASLKLPSKIPSISLDIAENNRSKKQVRDTGWFVAYGLCIWGASGDRDSRPHEEGFVARVKRLLRSAGKQLLP